MKNTILFFIILLILPQTVKAINAHSFINKQENLEKQSQKLKRKKERKIRKIKKLQKKIERTKQKFKFHIGGFLLGFLLSIYGLIIAWIWSQAENNKNIIKSAWLGFVTALILGLFFLLLFYLYILGIFL